MRYGVDNVDDLFRGAVGVARLSLMGLQHIWVGVPCCKHDVGDLGMKPNSTVGFREEAKPPWVRPRTKLTRPDAIIRKRFGLKFAWNLHLWYKNSKAELILI